MSRYDGRVTPREDMECDSAHPLALHSPTSAYDMNRVHEELEKLNIATDVINKLELQLDEAQAIFRDVQSSWTQRLAQMSKRLGSCIDKSRPYYEARIKVLEAQQEAHKAALRFERANRMHAVAKQQVSLTQESLNRQGTENVDPACLEVLNHHIHRVNEAEVDRLQSENEHKRISQQVEEATKNVSALQCALKRSIQKSKPYFEARVEFTKVLQNQKSLIQRLEAEIRQKKADYNASLRRLEEISEEIHEKRNLGKRDPGVGSESPGPPCTSLTEVALAQRKASESFVTDQEQQQPVNFPHEELDVEYRTTLEGLVLGDSSTLPDASEVSSANSETDLLDDQVKMLMDSPETLMEDIEKAVETAKHQDKK
uniref:SH3 domain-binding protein 5-like n=1 Tax=Trichuris muris TaxID=70415 RepID=A0A5S6QU26_TRIMR